MTKILIGRGDTDLDYPICRPSLDLDFTQEVLDPRITFSRGGSVSTRVNRNRLIETISANQPRFDYDPVTGECKGLLIEESRYNDWLYSGQNVTTGWNTGGGTLSFDNTQIAPDGSTNAIKFTESSTYTSGKNINQSISVTSGTSYTFSIFAKQPTGSPLRYFSILFWNTGFTTYQIVTFDPLNGTVLYNPLGNTTFVQKYPNGWWRFGVTATATATVSCPFNIRFTNSLISSSNPPYGYGGPYGNYTGDGSSYLYFFGPQVENGAFMTSYIPTTASTVTRSADLASITGTNFSSWYNQSEGTIYMDLIPNYASGISPTYRRYLSINKSPGNGQDNVIQFISIESGNQVQTALWYSDRFQAGANTTVPPNTSGKIAFAVSSKYASLAGKGTFLQRDTSVILSDMNRMDIGGYGGIGGYASCGVYKRITYYPRQLKDNQLVLLTQ